MTALAPISLMLQHEVRLNWRMLTARISQTRVIATAAVMLVFMHLLAVPFALFLPSMPANSQAEVLVVITTAIAFGFMMMLPLALLGTVNLIYSRGDMDLLLSSPVPPQAIVVVRVLALALGLFASASIFVLPVANVMTAFGHPRFLVCYVTLVSIALMATAVGVLLAQGVFALLGARRTRLFAQILAAVLGVGFLFAINLRNILPAGMRDQFARFIDGIVSHLPAADSLFWLPARAAQGELLPFLVVTVLSVAIFALTTFGLANRMIANAVAAASVGSQVVRNKGASRALAPGRGLFALMRSKEWVLIRRDPSLMTQIAKQSMMMLPGMLVVWNLGGLTYAWLCLVLLVGQLAGALAWLTVSTEEAADLLATAPVRRSDILSAKLQAALVPVALVMAVPLAAAWMMGAWLGFTILAVSAGCAYSTALYHVRHGTPAKRSDLMRRGDPKQMHGLVELGIALVWIVLGAMMLVFGWWGLLAAPVLAPALVWLVR